MNQSWLLSLRTAVIVVVLLGMPILALPRVNEAMRSWLDGGLPGASDVVQPPSKASLPTVASRSRVESRPAARPKVVKPAIKTRRRAIKTEPDSSPPRAHLTADPRFADVQLRLKQLGATYMTLQMTGERPSQYLFHCRFPAAGTSTYFRPFEAVHSDPLQAMESVLREVERRQLTQLSRLPMPDDELR